MALKSAESVTGSLHMVTCRSTRSSSSGTALRQKDDKKGKKGGSRSGFDLPHIIDDARMFGKAESLAFHLVNQLLAHSVSRFDDPVIPAGKKQLGKETTCQDSSRFAPQAMFWMVLNKENLLDFNRILRNEGRHAWPWGTISVKASA